MFFFLSVFVSHFLGKTLTLADEDGTAQVAKETYNETLAKYHPWLIRKGALMAMYTLPTKKELIKQVILYLIHSVYNDNANLSYR